MPFQSRLPVLAAKAAALRAAARESLSPPAPEPPAPEPPPPASSPSAPTPSNVRVCLRLRPEPAKPLSLSPSASASSMPSLSYNGNNGNSNSSSSQPSTAPVTIASAYRARSLLPPKSLPHSQSQTLRPSQPPPLRKRASSSSMVSNGSAASSAGSLASHPPATSRPSRTGECRSLRRVSPTTMLVDRTHASDSYELDAIYGPASLQADIFSAEVLPMLDAFVAGVNCTFLAYGQTGSGKTFTLGMSPASSISANAASMGMVPRALHRLFEMLDLSARSPSPQPSDDKPFTTTTVLISFLELYNEEWHDLLNTYTAAPSHTASSHSSSFSRASYKPSRPSTSPSKPASVQIRQTPDGRVFVSGALEVPVSSAVEAMRCLHRGMAARCTAATSLNDTSSRSHAIFTVTLQQRTDSSTTISKLHFVDLAGSERLKRTRSSGERLAEGISINQGLLTLGRVVNTLASNAATHTTDPAAQAIVPYRESKLTRMLQNSLGGNSKTVILACISSLEMDIKESVNTLKYAAASRKIRNVYEPNVESVVNAEHERAMSAIKSRVVELETENESLRARLAASDARSNHTVGSTEPFERIAQLENTIVTLEGYVARIKEERSAEMSVSLARIHDLEEQVDSWRTQLETLESRLDHESIASKASSSTLVAPIVHRPDQSSVAQVPKLVQSLVGASAILVHNTPAVSPSSQDTSLASSLDMSPTKPAPLTIITSVAQLLSSAAPTGSAMAGSEDGQPSTPNMDHAKLAPLSPLAVSPVSIQRQPSRTDSDDDAALLDKFMARYAFLNY